MRKSTRAVVSCALSLGAWACAADASVYSTKGNAKPPSVVTGGSSGSGLVDPGPGSSAGSVAPSNAPPMKAKFIDQTDANNPAGLSPEEVKALMGGGPVGTGKWLYPYEGTVFPRGTVAPLVMWHSDTPPDAVYLHMKSKLFEYQGVLQPALEGALFVPKNPIVASTGLLNVQMVTNVTEAKTQLAIPQAVWEAAGQQSLGRGDPFTLELTERVNGMIRGPLIAHITIAQAAVKGSLYYNACLSSSLQAVDLSSDGITSAIMRIPPGGNAELFNATTGTQCIGCHSVSADGSRVIAQRLTTTSDAPTGQASLATSYALSYQVDANGMSTPGDPKPIGLPPSTTDTKLGAWGAFGALYPDGSKYLSTAGKVQLHFAPQPLMLANSFLYDVATGSVVPDTGIPSGAAMPMFSPDGKHLVFTDDALASAHGLAVMNYDTRNHKATGYRMLVQEDPAGSIRPGWPVFLPDNQAVIFERTASMDFSGNGSAGAQSSFAQGLARDPSDLYIADMATGHVTLLAKAMGFNTPAEAASDAASYLPFGTEDLHHNYYPTVSPTAAGGYFWAFFDSVRHFGSLGPVRVLWGAAIDVRADGNYTLDPSHPPFYVAGQEFSATSHFRAFSARDRCKQDGAACKTGIDCCSGACALPGDSKLESVQAVGTCSPPAKDSCAKRDERCASVADCCDENSSCIDNFCAEVELL